MLLMFNEIPEHKNNNLIKNHEADAGYDILLKINCTFLKKT